MENEEIVVHIETKGRWKIFFERMFLAFLAGSFIFLKDLYFNELKEIFFYCFVFFLSLVLFFWGGGESGLGFIRRRVTKVSLKNSILYVNYRVYNKHYEESAKLASVSFEINEETYGNLWKSYGIIDLIINKKRIRIMSTDRVNKNDIIKIIPKLSYVNKEIINKYFSDNAPEN